MKLVCACTGNEHNDVYNYAVIDMSYAYVEWLKKRMAVSKAILATEPDLYGAVYFDGRATYYESVEPLEAPADGEFVAVPDDFKPQADHLPVSALTVCITDDTVIWEGNPKHGSGEFETATMEECFLNDLYS